MRATLVKMVCTQVEREENRSESNITEKAVPLSVIALPLSVSDTEEEYSTFCEEEKEARETFFSSSFALTLHIYSADRDSVG